MGKNCILVAVVHGQHGRKCFEALCGKLAKEAGGQNLVYPVGCNSESQVILKKMSQTERF